MKLPIKKKYFDQIKSGEKNVEWRAAHITFVCEETGETLRREVTRTTVIERKSYADWEEGMFESEEEFERMLDDENVIGFVMKRCE